MRHQLPPARDIYCNRDDAMSMSSSPCMDVRGAGRGGRPPSPSAMAGATPAERQAGTNRNASAYSSPRIRARRGETHRRCRKMAEETGSTGYAGGRRSGWLKRGCPEQPNRPPRIGAECSSARRRRHRAPRPVRFSCSTGILELFVFQSRWITAINPEKLVLVDKPRTRTTTVTDKEKHRSKEPYLSLSAEQCRHQAPGWGHLMRRL